MANDVTGEEEEIVLANLSDDELVKQMHDDMYDGLSEEIDETVPVADSGYPTCATEITGGEEGF